MNNVSLVGRLTKDVELRYTTKKVKAVGSFVLAVDRDAKKGVNEKTTDFIPIVVWGKTAEFASKYFAKGHRVALQGNIHTRMWEDEQKNKHYVTEVVADKVFFADAKYRELDVDDCQEDSIACEEEEVTEEEAAETAEEAVEEAVV
ncbi:MAG: single stranded DNA-binding protein [Eubacterium sp.]|jgi:single-strand DNA-binding protein|nr:single stranded DNA-binding protein [Eubacterium sp.]